MLGCSEGVSDHRKSKAASPRHSCLLLQRPRTPSSWFTEAVSILHLLLCWTHFVFSRLFLWSEDLQTSKSRDGVCFRFWWHLQPGPALTGVWVGMGSPKSCKHDVPGPEVHTVRGRKRRDPLQPDAVQMVNTASGCFPGSCMLWPLPALPSLALNTPHTHTPPHFLAHCITLQKQRITCRSWDRPHSLAFRSSFCLEYSPLLYHAFSPHPQPPWPETPTSPSSLNVDVPLPRNPSLYPKDWWDAHLHVLLCSKPLSQHHRVFNCLSTYWSLPLDNIDNF